MFIEIEETPNPATLKFLPGRALLAGGKTLDMPTFEAAQEKSPFAEALFQIAQIRAVFIGSDFISVSKQDDVHWDDIKPQILGLIMEKLMDGTPIERDENAANPQAPAMAVAEEDKEIVTQIQELLDTRVRPAVAADGGDIVFHGYQQGIVYLAMQGACAGCPSSTATLKMGIENMLRYYIPDVIEVRPALPYE